MNDALQFGALGVLAVVLAGMGVGLLWYVKETVSQQRESNAKLWSLIETTQKSQEAQVIAWGNSMQKVITILDTIHCNLRDHEESMESRHTLEMTAILKGG